MKKFLLDTCVVSDFFKNIPNTITHFKDVSPNQVYISTISVMEVEYGLHLNAEREKKIRPTWESLLKHIQTIHFCESCAKEVAVIRAHLKKLGLPIGPYDCLIAGTALAHKLTIVTSNTSEFTRIPNLLVEDWRI